MPRLLDYLNPIYAVLAGISPDLPKALFVALVFLSVLAWRKWFPDSWRKYSSLIPVSDDQTSRFMVALQKTWQALPSILLSALYGALGTGFDVWPTVKLALLGLLPPLIHELGWRYEGNLGDGKDLDRNGGAKITGAAVHGSGSAWVSEDGQSAGGELHVKMLALAAVCIIACGCASWKTATRTALNATELACAEFFGAKQKLSIEDAARQFCATREALEPWTEAILAAKREAGPIAAARRP